MKYIVVGSGIVFVLILVVVFCVGVLARKFILKRRTLSPAVCRERFLFGIREIHLPQFLAHNHQTPAETFFLIEEWVEEYGYTEEEMLISPGSLLGHALECQQRILASLQSSSVLTADTSKKLDKELKNAALLKARAREYDAFRSSRSMKIFPSIA